MLESISDLQKKVTLFFHHFYKMIIGQIKAKLDIIKNLYGCYYYNWQDRALKDQNNKLAKKVLFISLKTFSYKSLINTRFDRYIIFELISLNC